MSQFLSSRPFGVSGTSSASSRTCAPRDSVRALAETMVFNTARIEALELDNLIEVAKATIVSANARTESRGAHVRDDALDVPETPNGRDDKNWLKHSLWYRDGNRLDYKPVQMKPMTVETIELKKRAY